MKLAPDLEAAVRRDGLLELLLKIRTEPRQAAYSSEHFGNYLLEIVGPTGSLTIVKDRGLFEVIAKPSSGAERRLLKEPTEPESQDVWNAICVALVSLGIE